MKHFLAVFTGTPEATEKSGWHALSESAREERTQSGIKAWQNWMATNAACVVQTGGPIGQAKRVSASGVADAHNNICGYVVVSAPSHEAAAELFLNHPHFSIFPGDAVEVMPCLPTPGAQ